MTKAPALHIKPALNDNYAADEASNILDARLLNQIAELQELITDDINLALSAVNRDISVSDKNEFVKMFDAFIKFISDYQMNGGER